MLDSLRYAARHLRQSPGYVATAVLTFAVAIGANSAIFSAVNAVLLRPLPLEAPDNLAVVWQTDEGGQAVVELPYRHLREWTGSGSTFVRAAIMGSHNWSAVLQGRGEPSRIWFKVQRGLGGLLRHPGRPATARTRAAARRRRPERASRGSAEPRHLGAPLWSQA
ncbi:MAG: hypothetical protein ACRD15_23115 [Vicinamibacterales bacterium]